MGSFFADPTLFLGFFLEKTGSRTMASCELRCTRIWLRRLGPGLRPQGKLEEAKTKLREKYVVAIVDEPAS
jgi:hypothetical protein